MSVMHWYFKIVARFGIMG